MVALVTPTAKRSVHRAAAAVKSLVVDVGDDVQGSTVGFLAGRLDLILWELFPCAILLN